MSRRHQRGYIWRKGRCWYGRWWEDVMVDGQVVRKQRSCKLADHGDRYRSESDVRPLLDEKLRPLNEGRCGPESTLPVADYIRDHYLPAAMVNLKPSTVNGYDHIFEHYLEEHLKTVPLRDFRCVNAANVFDKVAKQHALNTTTLKHIKSFLSGVFTHAKNQGVLDGIHPIKDAQIPKKAPRPKETSAYSIDQVLAITKALKDAAVPDPSEEHEGGPIYHKAAAAVSLLFFAGLRPGEARGLRWEDYDGDKLSVQQSVWRTHVTEPKTSSSKKPVPVIEPLRTALAELYAMDGNPTSGPILRGESGKPLNLNNLAKRVVIPALKKAKQPWFGFYALRRGVATVLSSISKDPMVAKGLLRHSSLTTTMQHYIKEVPAVTVAAMRQLEELCNQSATGTIQ